MRSLSSDPVAMAALRESVSASLAVLEVPRQLRGRQAIVDALVRLVEEPAGGVPVHLLHGLGGSGKTSIAAEVARRASAMGVQVWWVSAADPARLVSQLHAIAQLTGASTQELQQTAAADVLWRRLGAWDERWLLVVDNADDPSVLDATADGEEDRSLRGGRGWVRPLLSGHGLVLVTSRRGDPALWGSWVVAHNVPMLDPADGAQVLLDHTGNRGGTVAEAQALAHRLGGLPLALLLAGSYLAQSTTDPWPEPTTATTFACFQEMVDAGHTDVFGARSPTAEDQQGDQGSQSLIDRIWQLAVQSLERRTSPLAGRFLRLLAQFADAPLPYRLMLKRTVLTGSALFADLDHAQARALLHDAAHLGLIDLAAATPTQDSLADDLPVLSVHPLMRDASRRFDDPLHDNRAYVELAARLLVEAVRDEPDASPQDPSRWPTWHAVSPHAFHLLQALSTTPGVDTSLADRVGHIVDLATRHLFVRGLRTQAQAAYEVMRQQCVALLGAEHPRTLAARHGLALVLRDQGDFNAARTEYEAVLTDRRRILGNDHPDTLITRDNLAGVLRAQGDFNAARTEYEAVLTDARRILSNDHPDTLTTRNNLAGVLHDQGDLNAARTEYEAVLTDRRRILGNDHPNTLITRNNLANVLRDLGHLNAARTEYEAVLTDARRILSNDHPDTLTTRNNLAGVLHDQGDLNAARTEYEAVLTDRRRILGNDHPNTLTTRNNLAAVHADAGRFHIAEPELQKVLVTLERTLGADHPTTQSARRNLSHVRKASSGSNRPVLWHGTGKRKKKDKKRK